DRFSVPVGRELDAVVAFELGPQLEVVVDLAVEGQGVAVGLLRWAPPQRLMGMSDVDDRQPVEPERQVGVGPRADLIRATVALTPHRVEHARLRCAGGAVGGQKSKQATHASGTSSIVVGGGARLA